MNRPATVERDIFQRRVVGVAEEMSAALRRSAFSSIIWEMYDYSCALFTPDGRMIAQAETIAAQLGVMETACRHIDQEVPIASWREGDVIVCNDPYRGCTHTPDIVMFTPVFADGRLVALASTIAHHVDIGGKSPCTTVPDNTEVFGEGLIFPPMKIVREGEENAEVFAMLAANVRVPEASLGDLRAQIAGCRTGERRVRDLVRRYETDVVRRQSLRSGPRPRRGLPEGIHPGDRQPAPPPPQCASRTVWRPTSRSPSPAGSPWRTIRCRWISRARAGNAPTASTARSHRRCRW